MKLVLVHGRSQQERDADQLRKEWTDALEKGYGAAGVDSPKNVDVRVPFYGKVLDDLTKEKRERVARVIARGTEDGNDPEAITDVQADLLVAMKDKANISDAEVEAELSPGVAARGPENWEWVHAIGRALSKRLHWLAGGILEHFLADVDAYLNYPHIAKAVNDIVLGEFQDDVPTVVVGHSLGSVVTYMNLTSLGGKLDVPLYVTIGSPLGIDVVKNAFLESPAIPKGVKKWVNGTDERDVVALYSRLDRVTFCEGIENISDLKNPEDNPHGIAGYLADTSVAKAIAEALAS